MVDNDVCEKRLINLSRLLNDGLVVIPNASEKYRNSHITYPYRHDSNFYYLTGFSEPSSALCLKILQGVIVESIFFCLPKNRDEELWTGERLGVDEVKRIFRFDKVFQYDYFLEYLNKTIPDFTQIYANFGQNQEMDQLLFEYKKQSFMRPHDDGHVTLESVLHYIGDLRLIKDNYEIEIIQRAIDITGKAHCQAARTIAPGRWEYEVEAELMGVFYREGSRRTAYDSIVASGDRACILHYTDNNKKIQHDDFVLIDAGCEYNGYASDITRTYPSSGKYEGVKKEIYELVLSAQEEAIKNVSPGKDVDDVHLAAVMVLSQGLIDLGILSQSFDEVISKKLYKKYYMHRTSHTMGADVHDTGFYDMGRRSNLMQPGVVITVEPGLYFVASDDIPSSFWGIGIRIEDDLLVTDSGCLVMSSGIPKSCRDVEAVMRS